MLNIFGLIPYHVIPKACQSMRHHTNTRQRKDVNSSGKLMMLLRSGKKRSILHLIPVCPQSSNQGILKSGQASLQTIRIHQWHLGQIITMENLEGQEGQTGTHRAGTKVVEGIRTVEGKVVAMAVVLTNKVEDRLHSLAVRWAGQVAQGVAAATVAMVQVRQIFRKLVLMVRLVAQAGGQIIPHRLVLETSSLLLMEETGNSLYHLSNSLESLLFCPRKPYYYVM